MNEKFLLLLIEDQQDDLTTIQDALNSLLEKGIEFSITIAKTIKEATHLLENQEEYDLILTDLNLSDSHGLETIQKIHEASSTIPIIATSATADEELVREIIRVGAQDYLPKEELDPQHLHRMIYASIERNQLQKSLKALSFTDELTELYNRRGFFTLLEQQIELSERTGQGFHLFIVDLDYLKTINDTYGHPAGDRVLKDVAHCLQLALRHYDIIARIGGDEFGVIALNAAVHSDEHIKRKIACKIEEKNGETTEPYQLAISIGSAYFNGRDEVALGELIDAADQALYQDKKNSHLKGAGPTGE